MNPVKINENKEKFNEYISINKKIDKINLDIDKKESNILFLTNELKKINDKSIDLYYFIVKNLVESN